MQYRDKKTGRLVTKATWKRSKARGGKRYVREAAPSRASKPKADAGATRGLSQMLKEANLRTPEDYIKFYDEYNRQAEEARRRRRGRDLNDYYEDQGEVETGIDYGEDE